MVTHCIRHLASSRWAYVDDLLVGTPRAPGKALWVKGEMLHSCTLHEEAITEHCELVMKCFQCMADHHLQVKEEQCRLFRLEVHQGHGSAVPKKVAAVCHWTEAMTSAP